MGFGNSAPKIKSTKLNGDDLLASNREVNTVVRSDSNVAICTDSFVRVESTFGFDPLPDSFFKIINTGDVGDTWTIYIGPTDADPSSPDRDVPSYTKIFTVLIGEVGDELALRDRIITELNTDSTFKDTCNLKANKATDRGIVHITSTKFSLSGEFWERKLAGDFDVTVSGNAVRILGFDNLVSRSKPISISRDPDSPHNLGVFGISGSVFVTNKDLDDLFIQNATDDGTARILDGGTGDPDLLVNGAGTPQTFFVGASQATDLFIQELRFFGQGNGIGYKGFLTSNNALTNGVVVEIKSDNTVTRFPILQTTADIKNRFSFGTGAASFNLDVASGRDDFWATYTFQNPFILKVSGSFGSILNDDYIKVIIQDNITSMASGFEFLARGFEKAP